VYRTPLFDIQVMSICEAKDTFIPAIHY